MFGGRLVAGVLAAGLGCLSPVWADDGYFLTADQKRELILRGQMHDEAHRLYDVWIVPGYVVPGETSRKGWRKAGDALQDYGQPDFFRNIHRLSDKTWRYGTQDVLRKFAFRGTRKAWSKDMAVASERTRKRVFGWWLAYPWGVLEASAESAVRLGGGIPTGVVVAASAYTAMPVIYVAAPASMATVHALGQGTAIPLSAALWNTVIAPPLAMLGQRPAPERADGFWMKQVDDPQLKVLIGELAAWRSALSQAQPTAERDDAIRRLEDERSVQTQELYARIKVIEQAAGEKIAAVRADWMGGVMSEARRQRPEMVSRLERAEVPLRMLAAQRRQVAAALAVQGWTAPEADMLVGILLGDSPEEAPLQRDAGDKTDPVRRVIEVMGKPGY